MNYLKILFKNLRLLFTYDLTALASNYEKEEARRLDRLKTTEEEKRRKAIVKELKKVAKGV